MRVLSLPAPDYGAALAAGFQEALGALIVSFDVDYYDLSFFDSALGLVDSGEADVVLASKRPAGPRTAGHCRGASSPPVSPSRSTGSSASS